MKSKKQDTKPLSIQQKLIKSIPGIIIMIFFVWLFTWGNHNTRKCKMELDQSGEIILMFADSSHQGITGNRSKTIYTTFQANYKGKVIKAHYNGFNEIVPKNIPAYVRYSFKCKDCYRFILDSTVIYKGYRIEYPLVKHKGRDFKITKIERE